MNHQRTLEIKTNNLSQIGLKKTKSKELAKKLNILLANYSIFHQNVRGFHWNLKGKEFFELHLKFEELYGSLYVKMDEIAERIVTLGYAADHNFSDYSIDSKISETILVTNGIIAVENVLKSLKTLIYLQREILSESDKMGDEGTYTLISDAIKSQEKLAWMYSAYLNK